MSGAPAPVGPARRGRVRRVLGALSPASLAHAVPGPVFQKEVRVQGRRSATYWTRGVYTCLLLGVVTVFYLASRPAAAAGTGTTRRLQELQIIAPGLTVALAWLQFVVLPLIAAGLSAPSVCEELRSGTLGTLLTTPLKAWQIVLGKVLGAGVQLAVLSLIAAPVLLAVRVFGGVDARSILAVSCLALTTAGLACAVGVLFSILSRRASGAMVAGIAVTALLVLWPVFVVTMLDARGVGVNTPALGFLFDRLHIAWTPPTYMEVAGGLSPALSLAGVSIGIMSGGRGARLWGPGESAWLIASAYNLAATGGAFALASLTLRRMMRRVGSGAASPSATPMVARETEGVPRRVARRRARRHRTRAVGDDPVLWRELGLSGFQSRGAVALLVVAVIALLWVVYGFAGIHEPEPHVMVAAIGGVVMLAMGAAGTTGGITGEREARSWELLLTTPLSARRIIIGKFAGSARRQWIAPAIVLGAIGVLGVGSGTLHPIVVPHLLLIIAPVLLAMSALGVLLSLTRKRTASAAVISFGAWAGLWMILPMLSAMTVELMSSYGGGSGVAVLNTELAVNPIFLIVGAVDGASWRNWGTALPPPYNNWPDGALSVAGFSGVLIAQAAFYVLLTASFLHLAATILARRSSRRR